MEQDINDRIIRLANESYKVYTSMHDGRYILTGDQHVYHQCLVVESTIDSINHALHNNTSIGRSIGECMDSVPESMLLYFKSTKLVVSKLLDDLAEELGILMELVRISSDSRFIPDLISFRMSLHATTVDGAPEDFDIHVAKFKTFRQMLPRVAAAKVEAA